MTAREALDAVSTLYVPGVAKYYAQLTPDPWCEAHGDLSQVMELGDPSLTEIAADRFANVCASLIDRFKKEGPLPSGVSPADAFHLGFSPITQGPTRSAAWHSAIKKICVYCFAKEGLKIVQSPEEPDRVHLVCVSCEKAKAS